MPAHRITYTRPDMDVPCTAIKYAHSKDEALSLLCDKSKNTGYRLKRSGVAIEIKSIEELKEAHEH